MSKAFPGFPPQMPTFFRGLERNNRREWFMPRKELFETKIRAPMIELVTRLNDEFRKLAPDHVGDEPTRLIYRIYRDTRFSKDKSPYKSHLGATFAHRTLPRHAGAGYYFEISHRYVGIAGGVYMPGPEELATIRRAIAGDAKGFLAIVGSRSLKKRFGEMQGESLTRLPKAWQARAESPVAAYLRRKQFYWWVELPSSVAMTPRLSSELLRHFRILSEPIDWFNRALLAERQKQEASAAPKRPVPMW